MNLRDYQQRAAEWLASKRIAMMVASAGSGKTIIAAGALNRVLRAKERTEPVKIGWVCNTLEQKQQAQTAMDRFGWPKTLARIRIECAASITNWSDRDVLIVDECHRATAPSWRAQIETCKGAVWGFTATPETDPERDLELRKLFADNVYVIERDEVAGNLAPAKVVMLDETDPGLKGKIDEERERTINQRRRWWRGDQGQLYAICAWQACINIGIVDNNRRNQAALRKALEHREDQVLMLVNQVEHGGFFQAHIPGARLCHSKMGAKPRQRALDAFREGKCKCIIATSMLDEGADLPMAKVLILVSGGRSKAKSEQRTGRVLRTFTGKTHATIYDFLDRCHPLMEKHANARMDLYKSLGYEVTLAL